SDLMRAVQTAEFIAKPHSLQTVVLQELREVNFGLWEGLSYEEIMATWPEILTAIYSKPGADCIPGGESFDDVQRRTAIGLAKCIANHEEETIVVVSHGGTMRVLLCDALGLAIENMWSLRQDSTAINIVEYYQNTKVVSLVNDSCHLESR
ncbi:MAG: histidine phosphatase family protein, partial [Sporomusaceae bacterium]|nr:histidine phosphatase family protein [Sporomusaceae bacterium]